MLLPLLTDAQSVRKAAGSTPSDVRRSPCAKLSARRCARWVMSRAGRTTIETRSAGNDLDRLPKLGGRNWEAGNGWEGALSPSGSPRTGRPNASGVLPIRATGTPTARYGRSRIERCAAWLRDRSPGSDACLLSAFDTVKEARVEGLVVLVVPAPPGFSRQICIDPAAALAASLPSLRMAGHGRHRRADGLRADVRRVEPLRVASFVQRILQNSGRGRFPAFRSSSRANSNLSSISRLPNRSACCFPKPLLLREDRVIASLGGQPRRGPRANGV